nr:serine protease [Luteibacter yeojuensis]
MRTGDGSYHCTASVIAGHGTPVPTRPALILTAGHCVEESDDNAVIVDRPADPSWTFTPAYFIDTQPEHVAHRVGRVVYATMKEVDLAVMELTATYGELAALGIHPLRLGSGDIATGTPVELVHVPVIDVPEDQQFLRHSSCHAGLRRSIVEGGHPWRWTSALQNDCRGVAGGTSGAPVFLQGATEIVGILNTTVAPGYLGCGLGRPCELHDDNLLTPREETSYAIPIERIARALRDDGSLDISRLDDGRGVGLTRTLPYWTSQRLEHVDGEDIPARWNLRIEDGFSLVRYKTGPANAVDCADIAGYSDPQTVESQPLRGRLLPPQDGIYAACVIGGSTSGVWQSPAHATVRLRQIDNTPPTARPPIQTRVIGEQTEVRPGFALWELVDLFVKYGPAAQIDCGQPEGYVQDIRTRWYPADETQPWRLCAYGVDEAGNRGPPAAYESHRTRVR